MKKTQESFANGLKIIVIPDGYDISRLESLISDNKPTIQKQMEYWGQDVLLERYGNITRQTLYSWRKKNGFPAPHVQPSARYRLWKISEVLKWESEHPATS